MTRSTAKKKFGVLGSTKKARKALKRSKRIEAKRKKLSRSMKMR